MITLNAAAQALKARALAGEKIPQVPLVFMDLPVPQRWAVGGADRIWGGYTWVAQDIRITEIQDEVGSLNSVRFTLPAVTDAQLALAAADLEGAAVAVYMAWVDPDTGVVADAPQRWAGVLDQPGWQDGAVALAQFAAEHVGLVALRQRPSRYTNDEQQALYPGDTSLDVDPLIDSPQIKWPNANFYKVPG